MEESDKNLSMRDACSCVKDKAVTYDDEITLIDHLIILWKRKRFVILASVLPTLAVVIGILVLPKKHEIVYTYDIQMDSKSLNVLKAEYFSDENLAKVVKELRSKGLDKYASEISESQTAEDLKKFVSFQIQDPDSDDIKSSRIGSGGSGIIKHSRFGSLLSMRVELPSKEDIHQAALIFKENFEQVIPLYSEKAYLRNNIVSLKGQIAGIEESRHLLNQNLESKKATLVKLEQASSHNGVELPSNIILQFSEMSGSSAAYLPLQYQIQATKTRIIDLEEQISNNKERYDYCSSMLKLNKEMFDTIIEGMSESSTAEQFHSSLTSLLARCNKNDHENADYLKAYIKRVENRLASNSALVERPKIYLIAGSGMKIVGITFLATSMMSGFVALLCEGIERRREQIA